LSAGISSARIRGAGLMAGLALAALLAGGCGGGASKATVVDTTQLGGLGPVLTTSTGHVLYMFPPDAERHVTCKGTCAKYWPPLTAAGHVAPQAGSGVQQSLLGTDPNPAGGPPVITYNGWPLYTFIEDHKPRQAKGQALYAAGGYWYVIAPSGQPITVGA
jgi:predicted lipoprotein with Yx(FWY)xxD motif